MHTKYTFGNTQVHLFWFLSYPLKHLVQTYKSALPGSRRMSFSKRVDAKVVGIVGEDTVAVLY
jgi:hypothetical protein